MRARWVHELRELVTVELINTNPAPVGLISQNYTLSAMLEDRVRTYLAAEVTPGDLADELGRRFPQLRGGPELRSYEHAGDRTHPEPNPATPAGTATP
jgi:hypothetical protein